MHKKILLMTLQKIHLNITILYKIHTLPELV